jgi:hypothetical protein
MAWKTLIKQSLTLWQMKACARLPETGLNNPPKLGAGGLTRMIFSQSKVISSICKISRNSISGSLATDPEMVKRSINAEILANVGYCRS